MEHDLLQAWFQITPEGVSSPLPFFLRRARTILLFRDKRSFRWEPRSARCTAFLESGRLVVYEHSPEAMRVVCDALRARSVREDS